MTTPPRRALVIAHEPGETGGQVTRRLEERGIDVTTHVLTLDIDQPNVAEPIPDPSGFDLIVPMGSVRSITRPDEISSWLDAELDLIRDAAAQDLPVLGVCFGGQLIAEALGGSVEEAPVTEIGWYELRTVDGADNPAGPGPWLEWHHDRFTPPPGSVVLAETDEAVQLFRLGRMVGTQFHPEVDAAHIAHWLSGVDDEYLHAYGQDRDDVLAQAQANEEQSVENCKALVDWFLDEVAFPETAA